LLGDINIAYVEKFLSNKTEFLLGFIFRSPTHLWWTSGIRCPPGAVILPDIPVPAPSARWAQAPGAMGLPHQGLRLV
jgi:hypothetical protein